MLSRNITLPVKEEQKKISWFEKLLNTFGIKTVKFKTKVLISHLIEKARNEVNEILKVSGFQILKENQEVMLNEHSIKEMSQMWKQKQPAQTL